jgi:photosystem II stability/assembly factor-like uncharacterized protein
MRVQTILKYFLTVIIFISAFLLTTRHIKTSVGVLNTNNKDAAVRYDDPAPPDTTLTPEMRIAAFNQVEQLSKNSKNVSGSGAWIYKGPTGIEVPRPSLPSLFYSGKVLGFDYNPSAGTYICSASGGLFMTFLPISDNLPSLATTSVAIHPDHPDTIFLATGEYEQIMGAGLFRSFNAGKTWNRIDLPGGIPPYIFKVMIPKWNHDYVFVASYWGIYRSTDVGNSWTFVQAGVASDIASATRGIPMLAGIFNLGDTTRSGLYRSIDFGLTWSKDMSTDLPSENIGRMTVAIAPSDSSRAYLQIANRNTGQSLGVFRTDYARLWSSEWWPKGPTGVDAGYMYGLGWYDNAIAVHPLNKDLVWLGGGALLRSNDGGDNWTNFGDAWFHADVHAIYYATNTRMLVGTDGGVAITEDYGATWDVSLNQYLPITQFYQLDKYVTGTGAVIKYGSTQDNGTFGTTNDYPDSWMFGQRGDAVDVKIDQSNPAVIYSMIGIYGKGASFKRLKTSTAPSGWGFVETGVAEDGGWKSLLNIDPTNSSKVFSNAGKNIYWTTNGGGYWSPIGTSRPGNVIRMNLNSDGTVLYYATDQKYGDFLGEYVWSGSSWSRKSATSGILMDLVKNISTSLTNPDRAYVLMHPSNPALTAIMKIFKTTDRGDSWTNITGSIPNVEVRDLVESPLDPQLLWVSTKMGVFKSTNGGGSWYHWNTGMPTALDVRDMEYVSTPSGDYILAGTYGRGTYQREVDAPIVIPATPIAGPIFSLEKFSSLAVGTSDAGKVLVSTDDGESWVSKSTPITDKKLKAIAMPESLKWIILSEQGVILHTSDAGTAWDVYYSPTQTDLHGIFFLDAMQGYAVGNTGTILRTSDGGIGWEQMQTGITDNLFSVCFTNNLNGWISGVGLSNQIPTGKLYQTTDGGQTWSPSQLVNASGSINMIKFVNNTKGYAVGDGGFALMTTDGGITWNPFQLCGQRNISSISYWTENNYNGLLFTMPSDNYYAYQFGESDNVQGNNIHCEDMTNNGGANSVLMISNQLFIGNNSGLFKRTIPFPLSTSVTSTISAGWNMLSIPVEKSNNSVQNLYPQAVSPAYSFQNGYIPQQSLTPGVGYWLKFNANDVIIHTGQPTDKLTIPLAQGWNMIGDLSSPIETRLIESDPPDIISSNFFGYSNGYSAADILQPGRAYWVKFSEPGNLMLDLSKSVGDSLFAMEKKNGSTISFDQFNSITVSDKQSHHSALYFSNRSESKNLSERSDLPPMPPTGAFDVRFASGKYIEHAGENGMKEINILVSSISYPATIQWKMIKEFVGLASLEIDGKEIKLNENGNMVITNPQAQIKLKLLPAQVTGVPNEFALQQNYPNPFNPSTTIKYELPVESKVTIKIYNALGQVVKALVDEIQTAGFKTVEWDASGMSSGIYFYRFQTHSFTETKKLLLLK